MWEEEKKTGKKAERFFASGVIILIFMILIIQAVYFIRYLVRRPDPPAASAPARETVYVQVRPEPKVRKRTEPRDTAKVPRPAADSALAEKAATASSIVPAEDSAPAAMPHDGWKWDRVELNSADSAALEALPYIGPYYAREIVRYRSRIGSYASLLQLLDIRGIDSTLLSRLGDRIYIDSASVQRLDLDSMDVETMSAHPYIGPYAAKGIDRLRRVSPQRGITMQEITDNRILSPEKASRLELYLPEAQRRKK